MPIDPTIALRLKPLEVPSPLDSAARVMSLRNLLNQGDLQKLQVEQATLSSKRRQALTESIANMTAEQANDPAFIRKLMLEHAEPSDLAKYLAEERAAQKPQFAPRQSPGYFQGGKWIPTPENRVAPPQQPSSLSRLIAERNALPQGDPRRAIYDQAITHATNPQQQRIIIPPQPPAPHFERGVDEQGRQVVHVFDRSGKLIKTTPLETKPAGSAAAAAKKTASEAEAEQTVASVRNRITRLSALIQQNPTAVGLAGGVRQLVEMAAGVGESLGGPAVPTPAIDFQNEQALLLSDVRKLVEKDPNLSKDERDRLYQTLGGGLKQTPSSAIRTMNNVLKYVEGKKLVPSRGAPTRIQSDADFQKLPSGSEFIAPDGTVRRKP